MTNSSNPDASGGSGVTEWGPAEREAAWAAFFDADPPADDRLDVATRSDLPSQYFDRLLDDPDPRVRAAMASRRDLSTQQIAHSADPLREPDTSVLAAWAAHPEIGPHVERLRQVGEKEVIEALSRNTALSSDLRQSILWGPIPSRDMWSDDEGRPSAPGLADEQPGADGLNGDRAAAATGSTPPTPEPETDPSVTTETFQTGSQTASSPSTSGAPTATGAGQSHEAPLTPTGPATAVPDASEAAAPQRPSAAAASFEPRVGGVGSFAEPGRPPTAHPPGDLRAEPTVPEGSRTLQYSAPELSPENLLKARTPAPDTAARRLVFKVTAGRVNPGPSVAEQRRESLRERARRPVPRGGTARVAIVSTKGGVGKTTTTVMLGHTFASLRGDRVMAVDANPDVGTLALRVPNQSPATIRDLLAADRLESYADIRAFTQQAPSRLEVLAADSDPQISEAFTDDDYRQVVRSLERFYNLVLTDTGTGVLHSAMAGVLSLAHQLVIVAGTAPDEAKPAAFLVDWLVSHGYHDLVSRAVVAINGVWKKTAVDVTRIHDYFAQRCRMVVEIPLDQRLYEGGPTQLDDLSEDTRNAYLNLAAAVADGFESPVVPRGATPSASSRQ